MVGIHSVVRTDLLFGTDVRSGLVSVVYKPNGESSEIDNGRIVKLGNLLSRSRTVYVGEDPTSADTINDIVLIASPEQMYNDHKNGLRHFVNKAGAVARGYRLHEHSIFSVTSDAISGTPSIGKHVGISDGTKISIVDSNGFGAIIDKNNIGGITFWVIQINAKSKDTPDPPPVEELSTTLFADGTLVINEWKKKNRDDNIAMHGEVLNEYEPGPYGFRTSEQQPWRDKRESVLSVEFGSKYSPTSCIYLFYGLSNATSFNFNNLDTSNVTNMSGMFTNCNSIDVLDLSSFDTSKNENLFAMFYGCVSLRTLDLSSFDTRNVTNMYCMFNSCRSLTTLDLSNFDSSSVTNLDIAFQGCTSLTTIYGNNTFSGVGRNVFDNCTSIVGGSGTTYDSGKVDGEYARIDNPPNEPGYFTAK